MTSQELRNARAKAIADARAISDAAGDKGMTAEQVEQFDKFIAESDRLAEQIKRVETLEAQERNIAAALDPRSDLRNVVPAAVRQIDAGGAPDVTLPDSHTAWVHRQANTKEYREAFTKGLRQSLATLSGEEKRVLTVGVDTAGGFLAPDTFNTQLIQDLNPPTIVRQRATVISGVAGDKQIPVVAAHGAATWTGESVAFTESDETFGNLAIGAHKLTRLIRVSLELMQDSVFDLEAYLRGEFARSFNAAEETAFVAGNGANRPRGFTLDGTLGVTAAAVNAITSDELIRLQDSMPLAHRANAVWVMASATAGAVRRLKSGDGQYLLVPGIQAGTVDTLLGRPLLISDDMPAMTTGLRSVYYINFAYYLIVDRAGLFVQLLRELYAANGQVGFIGYLRTDGRYLLNTAARYIQQA